MRQLICVSVVAMLLGAGATQSALGEIPAGGVGFAGMLSGVVVATGDGSAFDMRVTGVSRTWPHSTASNPESLQGVTVAVRASGELQSAYVATLRPDQRVTIDVMVGEKNVSLIELTNEQRKIAQGGGEKSARTRAATVKREGAARAKTLQKKEEAKPVARTGDREARVARDRVKETERDSPVLSKEVQQLRGEVKELRQMVEQLSRQNRELMEMMRSQMKDRK